MIAVPSNDLAFEFLHEKLGIHRSRDFRGALFVHSDYHGALMTKETVGVAYGWHGFIGRICLINIVVQDKRVLTREVIREAFRYPFENCGVSSVLALVDTDNTESMEMCRRTGFEPINRIQDGGLVGSLVIWEMAKSKCRWLKGKNHG